VPKGERKFKKDPP